MTASRFGCSAGLARAPCRSAEVGLVSPQQQCCHWQSGHRTAELRIFLREDTGKAIQGKQAEIAKKNWQKCDSRRSHKVKKQASGTEKNRQRVNSVFCVSCVSGAAAVCSVSQQLCCLCATGQASGYSGCFGKVCFIGNLPERGAWKKAKQ